MFLCGPSHWSTTAAERLHRPSGLAQAVCLARLARQKTGLAELAGDSGRGLASAAWRAAGAQTEQVDEGCNSGRVGIVANLECFAARQVKDDMAGFNAGIGCDKVCH